MKSFCLRCTASFFIVIFALIFLPQQVFAVPGVSAKCSILMEAETGTVLAENNADKQMLIASTTKIMTALVVIENCDLDDMLTVKREYTSVEGSSMYLQPGEKLFVRDVLYGLMLSSGNDAAVALACHTAGSVDRFAKLMNAKAEQLGMTNSSFKNPHGLDAEGHYSTARDMAVLTVQAMDNPEFAEIVSTKTINVAGRSLKNHNKLLWQYDGIMGVKTGFTKSAGRSLVSCAQRDGLRLVCVTLNAPDDWNDHSTLYNWAYERYQYKRPVEKGQVIANVPVISGLSETVQVVAEDDAEFLLNKDDKIELEINSPKFLYAGTQSEKTGGSIAILVNGEKVQEIGLKVVGDTEIDESERLTFWEKVKWRINKAAEGKVLATIGGEDEASKDYF